MSNDEFDALLKLIENVVHHALATRAHPNDGPRMKREYADYAQEIEEAREALVL